MATSQSRRVRSSLGGLLALVTVGGLSYLGAAQPAGSVLAISPLPTPSPAGTRDPAGTTTTSATTTTPGITTPDGTTSGASTWNVYFAGDSLLTRKIADKVSPFARLFPKLDTASLAIVNVETAITNSTTKESKEFNFNSPPRFAQLMADAGVDVGSLANNHSLDMGDQGMLDTIDALTDAGIDPVGAGVNLAAAVTPSIHIIGNIRVAVFGASQVIPSPKWVATPTRPGVASAGKHTIDKATEHLLAAVQQAKATNDVVLVMMHWGQERMSCPTDVQIATAKRLREAGATAVVGAHPHVLQPIVADGDGVIAYSMGNFIWSPRSGITADTGILELRFDGDKLIDTIFHPHRLDANGWAASINDLSSQQRIISQVKRKCAGADGSKPWPGN